MKQKVPKTVNKTYIIKVNGQPIATPQPLNTLKLARNFVANNLNLNSSVEKVDIIKEVVKHTVINTFKPELKTVLTVDSLSLDLGEEHE